MNGCANISAGPVVWVVWVLSACVLLTAMSAAAQTENLLEVFELALEGDPDFLAAGAEHRAAQEVVPQARAGLAPSARLTFETRWNERQRRNDSRSDVLALDLGHPIYRLDRQIALDQAGDTIARADTLYAAARQDLMVRVAERYFRILEARDELSFARATLEAFEQQLAQSRQRFEVGLIAITDVEEAKAGFDLSRAQLIAAENALDIAREALRETTGEYQERLAPLAELHLVTPEPADIDKWTEIALERNLRLLAATCRRRATATFSTSSGSSARPVPCRRKTCDWSPSGSAERVARPALQRAPPRLGHEIRAPSSTGKVGSSSTTPRVSDTAPRISTSDFTPAIRFDGKFATATICLPLSVSGV